MLRAAVVDVGGTLWPDRPPPTAGPLHAQRLRKQFGLSHQEAGRLLREFALRDPGLRDPVPLTQNSHRMASDALQAAGLGRIPPGQLLLTMDPPALGLIELHPGAENLLHKLKSLGIRCVILSNATWRGSVGYRRDFP